MNVAIVISSYNRIRYLPEAIDSCRHQNVRGGDVYVVVSDDGSKDGTVSQLTEIYDLALFNSDSKIQFNENLYVLAGPNRERGAARNAGAEFALNQLGVEWLFFLDSDDKLAPESLQQFFNRLNQIENKSEVAAIYADRQIWYGGESFGGRISHKKKPEGQILNHIIKMNFMPVGATLISARAFKRTGGFPENREMSGSEDWHFSTRLTMCGNVYYSPHVSYYYRRHDDNTSPEKFHKSILLTRSDLIPIFEKTLGARSKKLIRTMMRQSYLAIAGTFNSERRPKEAYYFAGKALEQDSWLIVNPMFWRMLVSISWRSLNLKAIYIIRLDDACPTMNFKNWDIIEKCFDIYGVKPIVGVIPENKHELLKFDQPHDLFWEKVRSWQSKGWIIAMHGYQHILTEQKRSKSLVPLADDSEFVGLSLEEQRAKIKKAYQIFLSEGVRPTVWMAPAHSFDLITLQALQMETPIRVITDGFSLYPYNKFGFTWLPQQLWGFKKKLFGVWTVCLHPNIFTEKEIEGLLNKVGEFRSQISTDHLRVVELYKNRSKSMIDHLLTKLFFINRRMVDWAITVRQSLTNFL